MASSSGSVIDVGYNLTMREEDIADVSSALIFRVPKTRRIYNDHLYSPQLVSIGPFHHGKEELKDMEKSKSEAVRRMQTRIQKSIHTEYSSIKSIVEGNIVHKNKEIREFYGEDIHYSPMELAWIVTRDACFLFEFLVNYVGSSRIGRPLYHKEVSAFSWTYDPVFDVHYQNPMREKLMDDILLFENQIPFWILTDLLKLQMGFTYMANQRLEELMDLLLIRTTRHKVFVWHSKPPYNECCHVLEVVYQSMVGTNLSPYLPPLPPSSVPVVLPPHNRIQICFKNVVDKMKGISKRCYTSPREEVMPRFLKLPTAMELTRMGVKIRPVLDREVPAMEPALELQLKTTEPSNSAIHLIRFDEKNSTLYLPELRITAHSYSTMRSIIAMEVNTPAVYNEHIKSRYHPRPMTQFGIFMDELIDNEEDVDVLRKAEVISNFLESNRQVADLFNTLTKGIAHDWRCNVIYKARKGLYLYTRRKYKILWNEFVSTYFSKPWLIAGSMGAVLLLLMTAAQVFCLFFSCKSEDVEPIKCIPCFKND